MQSLSARPGAAHRRFVRHTRECSARSGRRSRRPYPDRRRRARRQPAGAYEAMPQDLHRKVRWVAVSSTRCHSRRNFPRQPSEGAVGVLGCLGARGANPMPPAMRHGLRARAVQQAQRGGDADARTIGALHSASPAASSERACAPRFTRNIRPRLRLPTSAQPAAPTPSKR